MPEEQKRKVIEGEGESVRVAYLVDGAAEGGEHTAGVLQKEAQQLFFHVFGGLRFCLAAKREKHKGETRFHNTNLRDQ
jgi:hypothetical protein